MSKLQAIMNKVITFESQKEDVDTRNIHVSENGTFTIDGVPDFNADAKTISQVCGFFVPGGGSSYIQKCPPHLMAQNLNHWIGEKSNKKGDPFFVRTRTDEKGNRVLRAVLSARYTEMDNVTLLQRALPVIESQGFEAESFSLTDHNMHLRLTGQKTMTVNRKVGDLVKAGLHISNSETGSGSVKLMALLYRLVCTNGMVTADQMGGFRRSHIGSNSEMLRFINEQILQVEQNAFSLVNALQQAHQDIFRLETAKQLVQYITDKYGWTNKFNELVYQNLLVESNQVDEVNLLEDRGILNKFRLIQAVTHSAKTLKGDDRLVIERQASDILTVNLNKLVLN